MRKAGRSSRSDAYPEQENGHHAGAMEEFEEMMEVCTGMDLTVTLSTEKKEAEHITSFHQL